MYVIKRKTLTMWLDLSFVLQITLVRYYNYWEVILIFNLPCRLVSQITSARKIYGLTRKICWWNVDTSSKELLEVME